MGKVKVLSENVIDLNKFKGNTQLDIAKIREDLTEKAPKTWVKSYVKETKKKLRKEAIETNKKLQSEMLQADTKLSDKIAEIEKKLSDLEQNTLWKIKDCEELLKLRVNEKFVYDAIKGIEDKIKRELLQFTEGNMGKYDKLIKDLQKDIEKLGHDTHGKFKNVKDDIKDLQEQLNKKSEHDNCRSEFENLKAILHSINLTEFHSKFHEINMKLDRFEEKLKEMKIQPDTNNVDDDIDHLKQLIGILRDQLDKKADKSTLEELISRSQSFKDPAPIIKENTDMNEFWKFRERTIEQLKNLESRLEKLSKMSEMSSLKKLINAKANDEEMKNGLGTHDIKISELEKETSKNSKELESLLNNLRKLQALVTEISAKSGFALVGRKTFLPSNCLSCGRGDANFAPMQPHVMGRDGRLYKAENAGKTANISFAEHEEYDTGAEVFNMDTHEQFHFRRSFIEDAASPIGSRQLRVPLNVLLGKDVQKTLTSGQIVVNKRARPLSAKK